MSDVFERTFDRRELLKLGTVAGLALAAPLAYAEKAFGTTRRLRVGVIVPVGASYERVGTSLVSGLKLGLAGGAGTPSSQAGLIVREAVLGYGGAHTAATELLTEGVDVLVAAVSAPVAALLAPLAEAHRRPLVVANVGGHVVRTEARSAYVLHNSLQLWQASYAAGRWAARNVGKRAFVSLSRADAGYDTLEAFRLGLESAGGSVAGTFVTHDASGSNQVAEALDAAAAAGPDLIYGCYSGGPALEFVRGHAASGLKSRVPLLTTGFAVEDFMLRALGRAGARVGSGASWTASRDTPANRAFQHAFRAATGRRADAFAALGYDTGLLIDAGRKRAARSGLGRRRLVEALAGQSIRTPRGLLTVDGGTNTVSAPIAIRRVRSTISGGVNVEIAQAGRVAPGSVAPNGPHSGYLNEYLCT